MRSRDVHDYYTNYDAIEGEMRAYPDVNYRYLFEETERLSGLDELNFNNSTTWAY